MRRIIGMRGTAAFIVVVGALVAFGAGTSSGAVTPGPSTKTFSFIGKPSGSSKGKVIVNVDGLTINARCGSAGQPVVFAFSGVPAADLLGAFFDGAGRTHIVHNTQFNKGTKGVQISSSTSDFDASGNVLFETSKGQVVTVSYAFDNATTLNKQNVCTVYGSYVAS